MIIPYDPEWIATTPCPKRASVRLPHGSLKGRFLPKPGGTAKHLGRRKEGDNCGPLSPGWGNRSERETKGLVCVPLWWSFSLGTINTLSIHRWIEKKDAYGVRPLCFSRMERVVQRTKSTGNCLLL
ncbi:hypothetical protein [Aneurinibacillus migulanus]|uniref:hypothetical protein n=1 Tax=Aneurinibacillus migulanus TaxID=47500 RepID=UPI001113ACA8|nr:hypothetical protein [Aneurinibacillus migulanus]MED0892414.1 hypothetical protein [Aneurinibacillus migulanus]MED1615633.1 hypothetical protein [Aneurinibacillus migulanus]